MNDSAPAVDRPPEPYRRHRFLVQAQGLPASGFAEIRGLEVSLDDRSADATTDRRDRRLTRPGFLNRLADRPVSRKRRETTAPPLELWRGVTDELVLWNWFQDWVDGTTEPRTVGVYLLDEGGDPAVGWLCEAARPVAWSGPQLAAERPGVAMERLELDHEGLSATTDVPCDALDGLESGLHTDVPDSNLVDSG